MQPGGNRFTGTISAVAPISDAALPFTHYNILFNAENGRKSR
jgi:hypothetical protein